MQIMRFSQALAACLLALLVGANAWARDGSASERWADRTVADLADVHAKIAEHTPAAVDTENPSMQAWHTEGYQLALERAGRVQSEADWRFVLQAFVNGYGDPHLKFHAGDAAPVLRYPGFVLRKSGEGAVVNWRHPTLADGPSVGARLLSCDGKSLDQLLTSQVYAYRLNPRILGDERPAMVDILLDRGVFFAPPVARCTFSDVADYALEWRVIGEEDQSVRDQIRLGGYGPRAAAGLSEPAPGVFWIGLPSFAPLGDSAAAVDAARAAFQSRGAALRNGRAIVVDLRGNTGGTSVQGEMLAEAFWGRDAIASAERQRLSRSQPVGVDWRASRSNADYVGTGSLLLRLRYPGRSIGTTWAKVIAPGLRAAVRSGQPFFREGADNAVATTAPAGPLSARRIRGPSPFPATVYVLTNGTCASACLDFADIALNMSGVVHIGAETGADGLLMEVRSMDLKSGRGSLSLPIKVVRGRARGNLESYTPDVSFDGPWSDEAVRAWVLSLAP